jgi:hypothetical protein
LPAAGLPVANEEESEEEPEEDEEPLPVDESFVYGEESEGCLLPLDNPSS